MHGVSNRLTGGRTNARCLSTLGSAGMGEGWSDTVGMFLSRTAADTRYSDVSVGWYVLGDNPTKGIRHYPYSTRTKTDPLKLESLLQMNEVHNIG
jgi:extracellular elastinolytic metalloproteinase